MIGGVNTNFTQRNASNVELDARQRAAVVSTLRAHRRPVPYILFGPPGTGKTATLVEAVLQVLHKQPKFTVLVCGASNLCTDLLSGWLVNALGWEG